MMIYLNQGFTEIDKEETRNIVDSEDMSRGIVLHCKQGPHRYTKMLDLNRQLIGKVERVRTDRFRSGEAIRMTTTEEQKSAFLIEITEPVLDNMFTFSFRIVEPSSGRLEWSINDIGIGYIETDEKTAMEQPIQNFDMVNLSKGTVKLKWHVDSQDSNKIIVDIGDIEFFDSRYVAPGQEPRCRVRYKVVDEVQR